jgi:tryptophan synthase beta subunit
VEVRWDEGGAPRALSGSATLLVTAATSGGQERAAYGILSTPDTLLAIAATADVGNGFTAIEQAASDPTLGPHYAWLEAKRALRSGATTDEPSRRALERLAGGDVVVSSAERRRAVEALDRVEARYAVREEAIREEEVAGADDAPDVGSLRKLVAAARRQMDEAGRPR